MDSYVDQLEKRNAELEEELTRNSLDWVRHDIQDDRYFVFFHRCLLAQCFKLNGAEDPIWRAVVYNTAGSTDRTENAGEFSTLLEAKEAALKVIYSQRDYGRIL